MFIEISPLGEFYISKLFLKLQRKKTKNQKKKTINFVILSASAADLNVSDSILLIFLLSDFRHFLLVFCCRKLASTLFFSTHAEL